MIAATAAASSSKRLAHRETSLREGRFDGVAGGTNQRKDVQAVQRALNDIGASDGGAMPPLKVDGYIGPLTTGAIRRFQQVQFPGWQPDARIDVDGKTEGRINEFLSLKTS